jgi:hypothetical protein
MSSQYFGSKGPRRPHLVQGKRGAAGEVEDLRNDVDEAFETLENNGLVRVDTWTNPPVADVDYFLDGRAGSTSEQILRASAGDFLQTAIATGARSITVTRSASVGAYTTDPIIIKGKAYGEDVTLTFTPADADGGDTIQSTENLGLDEITEVVIPPQVSALGTFDIGFGALMVLFRPIRALAGVATPLREVAVGAVVTTGTFSGRKYTSAAAPDGIRDFAVVYIADPNG